MPTFPLPHPSVNFFRIWVELYIRFIPWQEVVSFSAERYYRAESPKAHKVQLEVKTGIFRLRQRVTLRVPATKKQAVLELLSQHSSLTEKATLIRATD